MAGLTTLRGELRGVASTRNGVWATVLDVAAGSLLFLAAAATGIVGGVAMAWLSWMEQTGPVGMAVAYASAGAYVVLLFVGCRLGAHGMDGRVGAFLPATGWILATLTIATFNTGGDILIAARTINYVLLFGGVIAVGAAVVTAPVGSRGRPVSGGRDLPVR